MKHKTCQFILYRNLAYRGEAILELWKLKRGSVLQLAVGRGKLWRTPASSHETKDKNTALGRSELHSVLITNSSQKPWFCLWNSPNAFSCRTVLTLCSFPQPLQAVCPVLFVWQSTNLHPQQRLRKTSGREVRKHKKPDPRTAVQRNDGSFA